MSYGNAGRDQVQSVVSAFIIDNFLFGDTQSAPATDQDLVQAGVIDSTGILELIAFLEEQFDILIADSETLPKNLGSLASIAAFVERKLGRGERAIS